MKVQKLYCAFFDHFMHNLLVRRKILLQLIPKTSGLRYEMVLDTNYSDHIGEQKDDQIEPNSGLFSVITEKVKICLCKSRALFVFQKAPT